MMALENEFNLSQRRWCWWITLVDIDFPHKVYIFVTHISHLHQVFCNSRFWPQELFITLWQLIPGCFWNNLLGAWKKMAIFRHILDIFLLSATFHKGTILDDAFSFSLQIVLSFAVKGEFKNSISHILCRHIWDTGRHCIAKIVLESRNIQFYNKINKSCLSSSSKNAQVFSSSNVRGVK